MIETTQTYYKQYLNIVELADISLTQPTCVKAETKKRVEDIESFGEYLIKSLPKLEAFPSLANSLFELVGNERMTGYLGMFLIDEAIATCCEFASTEEEIMTKIDRIRHSSLTIDQSLFNEIAKKAKSWRRIIALENMTTIKSFFASLLQQIDGYFEALSDKEKLGQALAQSEEERKRLLELEEARRRGITEKELDKEEKRRRAREEYAKNMRIRKKK